MKTDINFMYVCSLCIYVFCVSVGLYVGTCMRLFLCVCRPMYGGPMCIYDVGLCMRVCILVCM